MDLGDAATRLTKIMGGLGIEAADATGTVDVLAAVMSSANTNVPELANALEKVAPIAAAVNLPLEEVAATLGVLADNGFTGELAGTALRGMLLKLAVPLGPARQGRGLRHRVEGHAGAAEGDARAAHGLPRRPHWRE